jgi:CheY-like chemotaxis protein
MRDALRRLLGNLMLEGRLADTEGGVEVMPLPAVDAPLALVADDTEPVLSSLARHLQHAGFRIAVARNGTEVIERAREELPAVMVLDQQMPGPDGMEVVQQVRADSRLGSVPIVALSALVKSGDRERCLEAGANDYWSKPISGARLVRVVQAQLENRRKTEAL